MQEVGGIPECKVVTVVLVVGNDTVGVNRSRGKIGLVLIRSSGQREGIGKSGASPEEIARIVIITGVLWKISSPAEGLVAGFAIKPCSIPALELRQYKRAQELSVAAESYIHFSSLAILGSYHDGSIGGF